MPGVAEAVDPRREAFCDLADGPDEGGMGRTYSGRRHPGKRGVVGILHHGIAANGLDRLQPHYAVVHGSREHDGRRPGAELPEQRFVEARQRRAGGRFAWGPCSTRRETAGYRQMMIGWSNQDLARAVGLAVDRVGCRQVAEASQDVG